MATGVNDHPHSGWLGFYRHRREKTGARSAPIVAGLENPIDVKDLDGRQFLPVTCLNRKVNSSDLLE